MVDNTEVLPVWNWTYFCPTGLTPWLPNANYLTPCFQQICLQLPILILFAIISSYHFGRQKCLVVRNRTQIRCIYIRILAVLLMAFLPLIKIYFLITRNAPVYAIDLLVVCVECVTWIVHFGFLLSLRSHGGVSVRGPLLIGVLWITLFLLSVVWLRSTIMQNTWPWAVSFIILHSIYGVTLIPDGDAVIINRGHTEEERQALLGNTYIRFQDDGSSMALGHAQDESIWLSRLIFYWVNPLIEKGLSGNLRKIDDLFDLPDSLSLTNITERLQNAIDGSRSLFWALHRSFGIEFYLIGIIKFVGDMSGFAGPLLLAGLLREQTIDNSGTDMQPYLYALGLFGTSILSAFCSTHFNWRMAMVSMKMRMSLVTAIYRKTLETHNVDENNPDVLNLMSTDTDRIVNSCIGFHSFWGIPFQLVVTLYLLYTQIGLAFLAGVCFAIALIPINRWIANKIGALSEGLMSSKDARVSLTTEAMTGVKEIKLLAWEDVFIEKIQGLRQKEIKFLSKRKYLDALCVYFWATTPVLMCLLTFSVYILMDQPLNAATTFATVALLNMLIGPLNAFPWVLNGLVEAWISLKRVQKLIDLPNIDLSTYYTPLVNEITPKRQAKSTKPTVLTIQNASFTFDRSANAFSGNLLSVDQSRFALNQINLNVKAGELISIEGPVGGGKSSLLMAILAGLNRNHGSVSIQNVNAGFGYVAQTPWLQCGTIRENIVWGKIFDENYYKQVLYACALHDDIKLLGTDRYGIGEGGRTLSGGQRARVALARAVYQNKQIYIMDDILASLDAHVANHVVKYCIMGLLKNKTRIIVTENKTLFYHSNQILHVEDGRMSPSDVLSGSFESDCPEEIEEFNMPVFKISGDDSRSVDSMLIEESREYGTLAPRVFGAYWKAMGHWISFFVFASVILMQVTRNASDAWLAHWVADLNPSNFTQQHHVLPPQLLSNRTLFRAANHLYLTTYAEIAITNSILTLFRSFIFAYAGIKSAKYIHTNLLQRVFHTKFEFFDVTPLGRILNRFSSDTYTIDDSLPFILNILLAQLAGLLGALVISLYAMPWLALIIVPMTPVYLNLQSRYRFSSRDIKRLSSNALSPLYAHFNETIQGIATIRAMRAGNQFQRDFLGKLEESIRAQLSATSAQQWLGMRLKLLGAFLVGGAGFVAAITSAHASSPEMVGLAIAYALSITGLLEGVLNALAETEQELIAVERVDKYSTLRPERNAEGSIDAPFGWPCQGVIVFDNVSLRYREHLTPALSEFDFSTTPCQRIGIVGRTGAGKTSVLSALLRVVPLHRGHISIDGVDIATLKLTTLRSRIALVPQEPFLFSGTIRENLDPRSLHLDSEIWNAIGMCLATPFVQSLGGLTARLDIGGSNLSVGQKQLLCLSRALLKRSKIVVIDEGTAHLDSNSEYDIQIVLNNAFKNSTVLLIAHRLNGLKHVDHIVVLDSGKIMEEGSPIALSSNTNSRFSAMLLEQQNKTFN